MRQPFFACQENSGQFPVRQKHVHLVLESYENQEKTCFSKKNTYFFRWKLISADENAISLYNEKQMS